MPKPEQRATSTRVSRDPRYAVQFYEGLCRSTAARYVGKVEEDYEDLVSLFRIKAWRALESFDPAKSKVPVERYVFSCMVNLGKDLLKKKKRNEAYIEDYRHNNQTGKDVADRFDAQYLRQDEEAAFRELTLDKPLIPSTLDETECSVLALLYYDYSHAEIALRLSITKREVAAVVKQIREKMADWRPSSGDHQVRPSDPGRDTPSAVVTDEASEAQVA